MRSPLPPRWIDADRALLMRDVEMSARKNTLQTILIHFF